MRLIDADEVLDHLFLGVDYDRLCDDGVKKNEVAIGSFQIGWNEALKAVANHAPTVDAVEVVRCKNCKFRRTKQDWFGTGEEFVQCKHWDAPIGDMNGFCSRGERRDDAEN